MSYSKAVFLDRDGVLINAPKYKNKPTSIKRIKDIKILKMVQQSLKILRKDFLLIMVSNQPDVKRKKIKKQKVIAINKILKKKLGLHDIYVCYHDNSDSCNCRKPKIGMILKAQKKWQINLKKSFLIGDRNSDIQLGKKVGCKNFFIDYNYDEQKPNKNYCTYVKSLNQAVLQIKKL